MLVDKYALTKAFCNLILHHNPCATPLAPPSSFVRRVEHSMNRMDPLLKTLQAPATPPEGLVQAYLIHIAELAAVLTHAEVRHPDAVDEEPSAVTVRTDKFPSSFILSTDFLASLAMYFWSKTQAQSVCLRSCVLSMSISSRSAS
jgi:hypothetical protein